MTEPAPIPADAGLDPADAGLDPADAGLDPADAGLDDRTRKMSGLVARLDRRLARLDRRSSRYSWVRLGLVLAGMAVALFAYQTDNAWAGWAVVLFAGAFAGVVYAHRQVIDSLERHRIWRRIKATHTARMARDWPRIPPPPDRKPAAGHPFETDLNLSGPRSVMHLLDTAVSCGGSDRLRAWLLDPVPDPARLQARQALVRELTPLTGFRDRLTLHGVLVNDAAADRWDGERLLEWLDRHTGHHRIRPLLLLLFALAGLNVVLVLAHVWALLPALWPFSLTVYAWVYLLKRRSFIGLFDEAFYLERTLNRFRAVLLYLEAYPYRPDGPLARLCAPFCAPGRRPSAELRRIARIATAANSQKSEVLWLLFNVLMPWDLFFAYLLERYKETVRTVLPHWLDTWYDLEALCSLATFADLNPGYVLPEVRPPETAPLFEARALGHPLLPDTVKVRNDFVVHRTGEIALITGSNMSGKSTFLRTLGVNLALAYAGGPVDAAAVRTVPFRLFTCIQVADSVQDGISYFYAEVRRLKALLTALGTAHPYPLFFLIDEIFRGTNNRERLVGSRAFVRALAHGHGVGAISTHDLELVHLGAEVEGIHNFHFREAIRDGRMVFDYRLRPGPCPTTNALKIMQMEGLPVDAVTPGAWSERGAG